MALRSFEVIQKNGLNLVFGMEWFPLLGGELHRQARALARKRRASHQVITARDAASVGVLKLPYTQRSRTRLYSAAAIFASLHPAGTVAAIVPLPEGGFWLVAVHEGAVMTRSDQLHETHSSVLEIIRQLHEAHPSLVVHDESDAPSGLFDALFQKRPEQGELQAIRWRAWRTPMAGALALLLAWKLLGHQGLLGRDEASLVAQPVDPLLAWQQAIALAARQHTVHGVAGLRSVLDALQDLPVYLAGWLLLNAECRPQGSEWHCRASYQRDDAGDNQSLADAARPEWKLFFDPMEGAVAAWVVPMAAQPLTEVRVRGARHNETRLISALQSLLPAFTGFRLASPQPLPVVAPLDAQQQAIPRPKGLTIYQRRAVHVQAPLRSMFLLLPEVQHMSWDRVDLQVTVMDQPSLRSSSLNISLSGVLYEVNDPSRAVFSSAAGFLEGQRSDSSDR